MCAIASGWLGRRLEQKRRETEIVAAIAKLGGVVEYDYQRSPPGKPFGPDWLRRLLGENFFNDVVFVDFQRVPIKVGDADLASVQELTTLKVLWLNGDKITDAGLDHVKGLIRLESLGLGGTMITDAGLLKLKGLTKLQDLSLGGTSVSFDGEVELQKALPNCVISR
ncbi:MAG TPA: hypothetical protein VGY55_00995 [Pirellulales bacterium]|jgi:hypothetical protein|nr:hypothetical protein [Pirellulales bacterium]